MASKKASDLMVELKKASSIHEPPTPQVRVFLALLDYVEDLEAQLAQTKARVGMLEAAKAN